MKNVKQKLSTFIINQNINSFVINVKAVITPSNITTKVSKK